MKVNVEIPATDTFEVSVAPQIRTTDGRNLFIIGETFFIEIDSMEELAHAMIDLPTLNGHSESTDAD